jgi:hypothetical protein
MTEEKETYEINVWNGNKKIIEKVIKPFKDEKEVMNYITKNFKTEEDQQLTMIDPEKGYTRSKLGERMITWSTITTHRSKKGPIRIQLDEKDKELHNTLEKSITKETIDEWGYNEMMRHVRRNYWGNPKAKGYEEKK